MKRISGALLILFALLAVPVVAQQEGDNEIQLQGSLRIPLSGNNQESGSAIINWGRFVTDKNEVGVRLDLAFNSNGDLDGAIGPFWRYNFGTGEVVPFIGTAATVPFSQFTVKSEAVVQFEAGIRWLLQRNIAFSVTGRTHYFFRTSEFSKDVDMLFGFSYYWGQ